MCFHLSLSWSEVLFNKSGSSNLEGLLIFFESTSITNVIRYNLWQHASLGGEKQGKGSKERWEVGGLSSYAAVQKWLLYAPTPPEGESCRGDVLPWSSRKLLRWALLTAMLKMSAPDGLMVTFSQNSWEPLPTSLRNGKDNFLKCWLTEQNVLELVTDFFPPPFIHLLQNNLWWFKTWERSSWLYWEAIL